MKIGSNKITVIEVGPRDGFQNVEAFIPTEDKVKIINLLIDAGIDRIEASSFVHPKWVPQLRDAAAVFANVSKKETTLLCALIPNEKGLDLSIANGVSEVAYVVVASDSLNKENFNMSTDQSLKELSAIASKARNNNVKLRGVIGGAFGCPYEGEVSVKRVIEIANEFKGVNVFEISLADSIGVATPDRVKKLLNEFLQHIDNIPISLHFHNTMGIGLANAYAAYELGITIFESSISGLGGCPYAPGAPGNIATEGVVHMFQGMGLETGVNMKKLLECSEYVRKIVGNRAAC